MQQITLKVTSHAKWNILKNTRGYTLPDIQHTNFLILLIYHTLKHVNLLKSQFKISAQLPNFPILDRKILRCFIELIKVALVLQEQMLGFISKHTYCSFDYLLHHRTEDKLDLVIRQL